MQARGGYLLVTLERIETAFVFKSNTKSVEIVGHPIAEHVTAVCTENRLLLLIVCLWSPLDPIRCTKICAAPAKRARAGASRSAVVVAAGCRLQQHALQSAVAPKAALK